MGGRVPFAGLSAFSAGEKKTNAAGRRRIRALGWQCVRGRREGGGVGRELVREGE